MSSQERSYLYREKEISMSSNVGLRLRLFIGRTTNDVSATS